MTRHSYVQIGGVLYERGVDTIPGDIDLKYEGPTILPDLPDFVSPIDGSVVRGRRGIRDHCARHNVVPTAELKGLPPAQAVTPYRPDREAIRGKIIETIERKGYKDDH
jgi:hypothetical protein